jgi:hypothetical protein
VIDFTPQVDQVSTDVPVPTRLKFIPPKEDAKSFPRYASYGNGELKTHGSLSGARNSLNNRTAPYGWSWKKDSVWKQGFILENVDGEWYTLYHVKEGSTFNELPWVKPFYYNYGWNRLTESTLSHSYYAERINDGRIKVEYRAVPMTTDEYVQWRLAVERERLGII